MEDESRSQSQRADGSNPELPPHPPRHMSDYAEVCLRALAAAELGEMVSVGGAIGLLHYLDYRPTHDVDAWWASPITGEDQSRVVRLIEEKLRSFGEVETHTWGDVTSIDLTREGKTVFSFQIAHRSAQLEPASPAPWTNVLLDSFPDLVSSKMVALVERGAPRDFRDIYAVCQAELTTAQACWEFWRRRQRLSGSDMDPARARLAVETHLARISQHRPLAEIHDPAARAEAEAVRLWFAKEFLDAVEA